MQRHRGFGSGAFRFPRNEPKRVKNLAIQNFSYALKEELLDVQLLGRGFAWLDTGTMDSLVEAADFVQMIEKRQSIKISAPEEIAYRNSWISREKLLESASRYCV